DGGSRCSGGRTSRRRAARPPEDLARGRGEAPVRPRLRHLPRLDPRGAGGGASPRPGRSRNRAGGRAREDGGVRRGSLEDAGPISIGGMTRLLTTCCERSRPRTVAVRAILGLVASALMGGLPAAAAPRLKVYFASDFKDAAYQQDTYKKVAAAWKRPATSPEPAG